MKTPGTCFLSVLVLASSALLVQPCLAQPGPPAVGLAFEQWLATSGPPLDVATFEGLVTGDVQGRLVTRVLERVEVKPERVELKVRYVVYGSPDPGATPLLVAELDGVQEGTVASLSGQVLEGWLVGAQVTVRFEAMDCAPSREHCYRGTLNVYAVPPSARWFSCRKWVTEWPRMAGVIDEGYPEAGTIAGEVIEATPSADGKRLHLVASYDVATAGRSFQARVEGDQDNETGRSVLVGSVTSGSYRGAWVRAEYQLTTCDGHDPCWQGSITVAAMPATIQPSTAFQHTAVHRDRPSGFTVTATGVAPMTYQWRRDGQELIGRTNRSLIISSAQPADEGDYTVEVRNPGGTVISAAARLAVVPPTADFQRAAFTNASGARLPYYIFVPPGSDPHRKYPVVCFYHGCGSSNEEQLPVTFEGWPAMFAFASYRQQARDPALVIWPTFKATEGGFSPKHRQLVLELLDSLIAAYPVDTNRIYLGGVSCGASEAWDTLAMRPGFFAGALFWDGGRGTARPSAVGPVPSWVFGSAGSFVGGTADLAHSLRQEGGFALFTRYEKPDHIEAIRAGLSNPASVTWLLAQRRGQEATSPLALVIEQPTSEPNLTTAATSLSLTGSARTSEGRLVRVTWENQAGRTGGIADGTHDWSASPVGLAAGKTNVIIVTATLDTTWAPAFGGITTFSDTISVFSTPVRLSLRVQGPDATLDWTGGVPPFTVQRAPTVDAAAWEDVFSNVTPPVTVPTPGPTQFYRVRGR